ncbi:uncharacterized protein LOC110824340 [Carica papaya]|uniref:uncharacterized protein LOC110824340 n=1 Tax=Carica papaya TaxID=3649 RepID=UPI000B8CDA5E|nr:uncharacterized protein LOC110824340 [Carica papaya]
MDLSKLYGVAREAIPYYHHCLREMDWDEFYETHSWKVWSEFCWHIIRMTAPSFTKLCHLLVTEGGLRPTIRVTMEEQGTTSDLRLMKHALTRLDDPLIILEVK